MKNPNGYGTIVKLSGKRRKPYAIRVNKCTLPDGSRYRPYIAYFEKITDAKNFLADYCRNPEIIEEKEKIIPTIVEMIDNHIKKYESLGKSEKTINTYRTSRQYFEDIFDEKITDIRSGDIQDIINELVDDDFSYSTVNKVKITYSQICKAAMADDLINKNYANFLELPKNPKPDNRIFSPKEVEKILNLAKTNDIAKIIAIFIYTAVRPGIMINTLKFKVYPDKRYLIGGGKTEAGENRIIPIHDKILGFIKYFYDKSTSEYLFTSDGKTKYNYRKFSDMYYDVLDLLKITRLNPHKCRKTGLSMMRASGISPEILQKIAGHTDYNVTIKYYFNELSPEELTKAIDNMG